MKLRKFIIPIASIGMLSSIAVPLTSCSNSTTISEITVKTLPTKTIYQIGEKFSSEGLVLTVGFNDGSKQEITSGFTTNYDDHVFNYNDTINPMQVVATYMGKTATFRIDALSESADFVNCQWTEIALWVDMYESGSITEAQFCKHFSLSTTYAKLTDFIGTVRYVPINGVIHPVRVIDINHDTITGTNKKALFTFELVNVLSKIDGKPYTTKWYKTVALDYTNSTLRKNLTGQGTAKQTFDQSVIDMLPASLTESIKTVDKETTVYNFTKQEFEKTGYTDKLFSLTGTEMSYSDVPQLKVEGTAYNYWTWSSTIINKVKSSLDGTKHDYWLSSVYAKKPTGELSTGWNAFKVSTLDFLDYGIVYEEENAISFAFCI